MGHTVIAVPVLALESWVVDRTRFYDASFLSRDPAFVHAHVTLLAPWVPEPSGPDLDLLHDIAQRSAPFTTTLGDVAEFPDGLIHLRATPDHGFRQLTNELVVAFPEHRPYAGQFDVAPHLTLDRRSDEVTTEWVRAAVAHLLPIHLTVDRFDLQWWDNDDCRLLRSFVLGGAQSRTRSSRWMTSRS